uniref:Putative secreted protein n=1 Tax=Anopheles marajoara TaxID=58244 RepID=A0A2M4C6G7_9DIPT
MWLFILAAFRCEAITSGNSRVRTTTVPIAMQPHHGRSRPMCRNSIQFCTIPTGDQPPSPREANVGSAPATRSATSGAFCSGIVGGSGIVFSRAVLSSTPVPRFRTNTAAVSGCRAALRLVFARRHGLRTRTAPVCLVVEA